MKRNTIKMSRRYENNFAFHLQHSLFLSIMYPSFLMSTFTTTPPIHCYVSGIIHNHEQHHCR